ncbi:hypothetical protein SALBM135S_09831 [Streptomyces alboniger]
MGGYALYLFVLAATGGFPGWFGAKREGLARALGLAQISGFNSPGSPPFLDRLAANGALYATSYALIGLGACATGGWCGAACVCRTCSPALRGGP